MSIKQTLAEKVVSGVEHENGLGKLMDRIDDMIESDLCVRDSHHGNHDVTYKFVDGSSIVNQSYGNIMVCIP